MCWDEPVNGTVEHFSISPDLAVDSIEVQGTIVLARISDEPIPGDEYTIQGSVRDLSGNSTSFAIDFIGYNANPAQLRINEICLEGNKEKPDFVELLVIGDGNTGGMRVNAGAPGNSSYHWTMPALEVMTGDLITIWWKELNSDALEGLREYPLCDPRLTWAANPEKGLTATRGLVVLEDRSRNTVIDCFAYALDVEPGDEYNGLGSRKNHEQLSEAVTNGWWEGELPIIPQMFFDPEKGTTTRSINRRGEALSSEEPTNPDHWFIGATGTRSPGQPNTLEEYRD